MPNLQRRRALLAATLSLSVGLLAAPAVSAQNAATWPEKPLHLIVSTPPGGHLDAVSRLVAPRLAEILGQPVVVENRPGANGNIAGTIASRAEPDGYTFLAASADMVAANPSLYALEFDPVKDFTPITQWVALSMMVVARPDFPANDPASLIAHLKASEQPLSYGTPGVGSGPHIAAEVFQRETGIKLNHVPYKGLAAALTDLIGGHLDLVFDAGVSLPQVRDDKLKILAVVTRERLPEFPNIGTLGEAGVPGFDEDPSFVLLAPTGTPQEIIDRLQVESARILQEAPVQAQLAARNLRAIGNTPEQAQEVLQKEVARQSAVIREAGIRVE